MRTLPLCSDMLCDLHLHMGFQGNIHLHLDNGLFSSGCVKSLDSEVFFVLSGLSVNYIEPNHKR